MVGRTRAVNTKLLMALIQSIILLINRDHWLINGITWLIDVITRLTICLTRLIHGWGARPGPRGHPPPNPPSPLLPRGGPEALAGQPPNH